MLENDANNSSSPNNDYDDSSTDYLKRAAQACASGDPVLGMHLYLAAFEQARADNNALPNEEALASLKQAWHLACMLKERSMAEYIFERLEPYLSAEETERYAAQLQDLALDKLEEYGLSREDLEEMADFISQDFLGLEQMPFMKLEQVNLPSSQAPSSTILDSSAADSEIVTAAPDDSTDNAKDSKNKDATDRSDGAQNSLSDTIDIESENFDDSSEHGIDLASAVKRLAHLSDQNLGKSDLSSAETSQIERVTYKDLVGYDEAISIMRDFGVGLQKDPQFQELVSLLNARHGLDSMPACDALLFRSPAREDAARFLMATVGELGLPAVRMRMEESPQGMPMLCVMAQADHQPKLNASHNAFEGAGVLILEDLDLWISPFADRGGDDFGDFLLATLSRGAREAITLIRSAVENPDVFVLGFASDSSDIDPFFYDLLEPLSVIDIDYPTASERADIWMEIERDHPSMRSLDRDDLVRFSAHMPRYDMYMAAREALEETYKAGLMAGNYIPVSMDNICDKLAAYQPLDSDEYKALEDAVVKDFRLDLDNLEDLLNGEER